MRPGTLIALIALFVLVVVLAYRPALKIVIQVVRAHEPENRWRAVGQVLRILVKTRTRVNTPLTLDGAAFLLPDEATRNVPFDTWQRIDSLVVNAVNVTTGDARTLASALDVDGSVAVVHHRDDDRYDIRVLGPAGSIRPVTGPNGVSSAVSVFPCIDRGTVAWWEIPMDGKAAALWVAQPLAAPRLLHVEALPHGQSHPFTAFGWVLVAGDRVAWTLDAGRSGKPGTIGVTSMDGTTHRVGTPSTLTLHRDLAAELQGRRVAAVNMTGGLGSPLGQVAAIDLDGSIPTVRILRSGTYPGASVCNGSVVGYWSSQRILQLPDGVHVAMPVGTSAIDMVSDGEWCAGLVFNPPDGATKNVSVNELFHIPTGARQRLSENSAGLVHIRGNRILWKWAPEGHNGFGASSWVGELRAPVARPAVGSAQGPE